jgi:hypothetical protein
MSTPTTVLAGLVGIEIWDSVGEAYEPVLGLDTITPEHKTTDADMSTKEALGPGGYQLERTMPARRAKSWKLEGKYLVDTTTGAQDDGQELMEAAGKLNGTLAVQQFRFSPAGGVVSDPDAEPTPIVGDEVEFLGTVVMNEVGGGDKDEPAKWSATIRYYSELPEEE